jgi:hypothetical protein
LCIWVHKYRIVCWFILYVDVSVTAIPPHLTVVSLVMEINNLRSLPGLRPAA